MPYIDHISDEKIKFIISLINTSITRWGTFTLNTANNGCQIGNVEGNS
jgi:hypothetical protein